MAKDNFGGFRFLERRYLHEAIEGIGRGIRRLSDRLKQTKKAHRLRCGHDLPIFRESRPNELSKKHCHGLAKEITYLQHVSCDID